MCVYFTFYTRPPFEVTEVWLESLSMHLSVGIQLPSDLVFDIDHYTGQSPSSSGSTTPEGLPSGCRSPILEPICEGKTSTLRKDSEGDTKIMLSAENLKPIIKVSSADNLISGKRQHNIKPILKNNANTTLSKSYENCSKSSENKYQDDITCTKSCEDFNWSNIEDQNDLVVKDDVLEVQNKSDINDQKQSLPDYENINFLRNDSAFLTDSDKLIGIEPLKDLKKENSKNIHLETLDSCTQDKKLKNCNITNSSKGNIYKESRGFLVPLRKVPKNFTRNQFLKENLSKSEVSDNTKSNLTVDCEPHSSVKDRIKFLSKKSTFEVNKPNKSIVNTQQNSSSTLNKLSNLSLQNMNLKSNTLPPSSVTQKYVNSSKPKAPTKRKSENSILGSEKFCSTSPLDNTISDLSYSSHISSIPESSTSSCEDQKGVSRLHDIPDIVSSTLNRTLKQTCPNEPVVSTDLEGLDFSIPKSRTFVKPLDNKSSNTPIKSPNSGSNFCINRNIFKTGNEVLRNKSTERISKSTQKPPIQFENFKPKLEKIAQTKDSASSILQTQHKEKVIIPFKQKYVSSTEPIETKCVPSCITKNFSLNTSNTPDFSKPTNSGSSSNSVVKNIIQTLNRRDTNKLDFRNRNSYGRSSLKVMGNPKVDISSSVRCSSPEEFTAL